MAITTRPIGVPEPVIPNTGPSSLGGEAASFQAEITRQQSDPLGRRAPIQLASATTATGTLIEGAEFALPRIGALLPSAGALATGVAAAVPVLLIPTNSSHLQQGALPGHPDIGYRYYESETGIRFYRINPDGSEGPTLWSGERSRVQRPDGSLAVNVEALRRVAAGDSVGPIIGGGLQPPRIEGLDGPIGGGFQPPRIEGLDGPIGGGFTPQTIEGINSEALIPPAMPDITILENRSFDKVNFNINRLPQAQQDAVNATLAHINAGTRPTTPPISTNWGATFQNRNGDLPEVDRNGDEITYREYRVDSAPFGETGAGSRRIVVGSDGQAYFTGTHYGDNPGKSFVRIR